MATKFKVAWNNGMSACGTFPQEFDTYADADAYGRDWSFESNVRDFGCEDPEEGYSYEVVEIEVDDPEDADSHEGAEHMRLKHYGRP